MVSKFKFSLPHFYMLYVMSWRKFKIQQQNGHALNLLHSFSTLNTHIPYVLGFLSPSGPTQHPPSPSCPPAAGRTDGRMVEWKASHNPKFVNQMVHLYCVLFLALLVVVLPILPERNYTIFNTQNGESESALRRKCCVVMGSSF